MANRRNFLKVCFAGCFVKPSLEEPVEMMRIHTNGNVGLGTSTPTERLELGPIEPWHDSIYFEEKPGFAILDNRRVLLGSL